MAELTYRPWKDADGVALNDMWGDAEHAAAAGRDLFREATDAPFSRTIVAEDQTVPVAAGVVAEASVHPQRLWAYIEVAKDHRNHGVAATLLAMLRQEAAAADTSTNRLRAKVGPGTAGEAFAASAGLGAIQRSRIVRVSPGSLGVGDLAEDESRKVEDLATGSVELTRALWDFYRDVHQWDPPAEIGIGKVNQLFLGHDAGAHGAVVLRAEGSILAFAISYTQPQEDPEAAQPPADVLLGYDTSSPASASGDGVRQLLALLTHQYPVEVEVDDSMEVLCQVLDPLIASGAAEVVSETNIVSE
ncbi:GNAT family N-acetyltransferase [Arthrobacter castelli]|uniref:GNAT family N-acetyltransferase n=1 Tax=Arthrobacter castelli TaxID=271431 RepID=UPI000404C4F9|nr:GNAT family N-acetyltransferase [Arthrobacter castelli]